MRFWETSLTYDANPNLIEAVRPSAQTADTTDDVGNLLTQTLHAGAGWT